MRDNTSFRESECDLCRIHQRAMQRYAEAGNHREWLAEERMFHRHYQREHLHTPQPVQAALFEGEAHVRGS